MSIIEKLNNCPKNPIIGDNLVKAYTKINSPEYETIVCSISGGSDSDLLIDICERVKEGKEIQQIYFDTGLEYQATKDHLKYLEAKYGVNIQIEKAVKPIPLCCKEYGQPFLSKQISTYISRLQKHGFQWEDEPLEVLHKKYPKCLAALKWWCDEWGEGSRFNISHHRYLKEFMKNTPPQFKISDQCCHYAKKLVAQHAQKRIGSDLNIIGVRKAEGGVRATAYKNCFTGHHDTADEYRPIFHYTNQDKEEYETYQGITHSRCYTEYGLSRTGCAGCPFGRNFEFELEIIKKYEPKLYVAVTNIFGDSYEYTRKYKEFIAMKKTEEKQKEGK